MARAPFFSDVPMPRYKHLKQATGNRQLAVVLGTMHQSPKYQEIGDQQSDDS
jgi:hypothetical protein